MSVGTGTEDAQKSAATQDKQTGGTDQAEEKKTTTAQAEDEKEEGDEEEPDPLTIARFAGERNRRPYAEQFQTDDAWLDHVEQLERTIGQRNEDALLGKQIRERLTAEGTDVEAVLSGTSKRAKQTDDLPEVRPEWISFDEQGRLQAMPGAPPDVARRYLARLHLAVTQPEKYLDKVLGPQIQEIKKKAEETRLEMAQREEQEIIDRARTKHADLLFVGGDPKLGPTPFGQEMIEAAGQASTASGAAMILDKMAKAAGTAQSKTKTNHRQVSQRAIRQPGIAPAAGQSEKELDALLEQGAAGLAKALRDSAERQKAAEV